LTFTTRPGRGNEEIGLAAEEGWDLQNVHDTCHFGALAILVHVRQHGEAKLPADVGEHGERLFKSHAALAREAGAVGLVEAGLVDKPDTETAADLLEAARHHEGMVAAFHLAGSGDERYRQGIAEPHRAC
jgi:hypothetical protein